VLQPVLLIMKKEEINFQNAIGDWDTISVAVGKFDQTSQIHLQ